MKKGFTLVELLAILIVLGLIAVVSFVSISSMIKKSNDKNYEKFLETLYLGAETYIENNDIIINNEEYISINDLINAGLIKQNIKNPKTNRSIVNDTIRVTASIQDGNTVYNYLYVENGE